MARNEGVDALRGAAALQECLDTIGAEGLTDHDLAKIIVENELECRTLVRWAVARLATDI